MRDEHTRVSAAGGRVVAIVMGSPGQAERFCAERSLPFACLADPDRSAYAAFAVPSAGVARWLLNAAVVRRFLALARRGVGAGLPHPGQDVRQMPATFVVSRGGVVRLAHYARNAADAPSVERVLGALGAG